MGYFIKFSATQHEVLGAYGTASDYMLALIPMSLGAVCLVLKMNIKPVQSSFPVLVQGNNI